MNYRELVAFHLQTLKDRGLTNDEIAAMLGFAKGNYISMLMNMEKNGTVLAFNRLPALTKACGLNDYEAMRLVFRLAKYHSASGMDLATLQWQAKVLNGARLIYRARSLA